MKKFWIILLLITLLGFGLRIFQIDKVPAGFSNDEVSIAYNAYSIWNTGKDEYGTPYPASFRSHNTYKAPLIIYLASPLTALFGNTELAIRLPSVLLGSLTIFMLGILVHQLLKKEAVSLIAAFVLAITPWHIYTSRIALESNVALFCLVTAVVLLIHYLHKNKKPALFSSVLFFVLSIYGYHTEWIFTPLLLLTLFILHKQKIVKEKRMVLLGIGFGIVLLIPLLFDYIHNLGTTARANTEFFLNDFRLHSLLTQYNAEQNIVLRILITFLFWLASYLQYFSPSYLFFTGLPLFFDFSVMKFGLFLFIFLPFFIIGLFELKKVESKTKWFILSWLLIGPLIPSVTLGGANLVRNLITIIPLTIIIALGLHHIIDNEPFLKAKKVLISIIIVINFGFFYFSYLTVFPYHLAENWSYGFKEIALYTKAHESEYKKIVIDPQYGVETNNLIGVPSLFILYFAEYNPKTYLVEKNDQNGALTFGKYQIRKVNWSTESPTEPKLYVVSSFSTPLSGQKVKKVHTISLPNGKEAFRLYATE